MKERRSEAVTAGLGVFLLLSFLGSWFVAAALRVFQLNVAPGSLGTRLFTTSLLYAAAMGWQPLLATVLVRSWVDSDDAMDLGLRPSPPRLALSGALAAVALAATATAVAWAASRAGLTDASTLNGTAEPATSSATPGLAAHHALAFFGALVLVWVQTFSEELGWRGYFLPRAMARFGDVRGLLLQGVGWGLWYAPVLFFATYSADAPLGSVTHSLAFVVTCALLGTLLGGLRLASKSLAPAIAANVVLTLVAGLPYVMHGVDAGLRSAIFGPAGWLVLTAAVAVLLGSRLRDVVRLPTEMPEAFDGAPLPAHARAGRHPGAPPSHRDDLH